MLVAFKLSVVSVNVAIYGSRNKHIIMSKKTYKRNKLSNNSDHYRKWTSCRNELLIRTVFVGAIFNRWLLTKTFVITETVHTFNAF